MSGQGELRRLSALCSLSRAPGLAKKPPKTQPAALKRQIGHDESRIQLQPILAQSGLKSQRRGKSNLKQQWVKSKVSSSRRSHKRDSKSSIKGTTSSLLDSDRSSDSSTTDNLSAVSSSSSFSTSKRGISESGDRSSVKRPKRKNSQRKKQKDLEKLNTIQILQN